MARFLLASLVVLVVAALLGLCLVMQGSPRHIESDLFSVEIVDKNGPTDPWGKSLGDLDQDGKLDIVVGGHSSRGLVYYSSANFAWEEIGSGHEFSTDHEVADMDGDGNIDVVSLTASSLLIFYGPNWQEAVVDNLRLHDIEVADLDGDNRLDLVGRNQGAFSHSGRTVFVFGNSGRRTWKRTSLEVVDGEGLAIADLNGDDLADVVINQFWLENTGVADISEWKQHRYTDSWDWPNAIIATGDINSNGRADIVAAPAELAGQRYRISWFGSPADSSGLWPEQVIEDDIEAAHHSLQAVDINLDGYIDIVTAEMHQSQDPDDISVYLNRGKGNDWAKNIVGRQGSHGMRVGDLDNDGDPDMVGANWSGDDQSVYLWRNLTCSEAHAPWSRHVIDPDQRWTSLFVTSEDLNGDGWKDIVSGAWWYENPGPPGHDWKRRRIAHGGFNAALLTDVDNDGDFDVFGTEGKGTEPSGSLVFGINDGSGSFRIRAAGSVDGDFLQGVAAAHSSGSSYLILSWHRPDTELFKLDFSDGVEQMRISSLLDSNSTQNEAISLADFNNDGTLDIVLGTLWLASTKKGYEIRSIARTDLLPDRNIIADIDHDGLLDIVVGFEAIDEIGPIQWFRNPGKDNQPWRATTVADIVGPMSVDAGDVDLDGDIDLVAGEHNLSYPDQARMYFLENVDGKGTRWNQHVIYTGDEHHDCAQLTDIDNDGDLDILSIGWSHKKVLLYVNRINQCN